MMLAVGTWHKASALPYTPGSVTDCGGRGESEI